MTVNLQNGTFLSKAGLGCEKKVSPTMSNELNSLTSKIAKNQNSRKIPSFILENIEKQIGPCKSTAEDVDELEYSHHRKS